MPTIINDNPRKIVPTVNIRDVYVDEREALVDKTKKRLGEKAKGMHFFYGDKNIALTGRYTDDGYIPVEGVNHRGDPLFMRPLSMHKSHLEQAAADSIAIKQATKRAENEKYKTVTADGNVIGPQEES